jgi:hypothetical protein
MGCINYIIKEDTCINHHIMSIKEIKIYTFPPIQNVVKEMTNCQHILSNILSTRFKSEHNTNTLHYAQEVLDGYCYVPDQHRLWSGRYVRYLDMQDAYKIDLKKGGFCIGDNGYTVKLRSNNKVFNVSRRDRLWFMVINDTDVTKIKMKSLI